MKNPRRNRPTRLALSRLETRAVPSALQVVHNSPYAAAAVVDVYVNDELAIDNLEFREATGFLDLPAGKPLEIDITAGDATDNKSPVFSTTVTLEENTDYIAAAVGDPGVTSGPTAFGLAVTDIARQKAADGTKAEFLVLHGSPDAPTVDIRGRGVGTLVDDISFREYADDYLAVPPGKYTLDVTLANGVTPVAAFEVDLSGAAGKAVLVAASGFAAPAAGQPGFALLAVFADGTTATLDAKAVPTAGLQIVHNSPYAAAKVVDVYANDNLLLDDVEFREATAFLTVQAGADIEIDITAGNATDNKSPVFSTTVNLEAGKDFIAVAAGDPAASAGLTKFGLQVFSSARRAASDASKVDLLVFHGSPDAPTVDVRARGVGTLVDDISFTEFRGYLSPAPGKFILDVTTADGSVTAGSFAADLSGAAGAAVTVAASGFLTPEAGEPGFGLLAIFADGKTALLPAQPGAAADTAVVAGGAKVSIDVLANDTDLTGELTITNVSDPANGKAVVVNGRILYTPDAGFNGTETFTYTVTDGDGGTATSTVTVTVQGTFGDADDDGDVDARDVLAFRRAFGTRSGNVLFNPAFDADGDGVITRSDLLEIFAAFRR